MDRLRHLNGRGFLLILFACGLNLPLARGLKKDSDRELAIAMVERAGGIFSRDETRFDNPVVMVSLRGIMATEAVVPHLKELKDLRFLSLTQTKFNDSGIAHLKGLTHLESLFLNQTRVTDSGLDELKKLPRLRWLSLVGTQVSKAGVKELQREMPRLKVALNP